MTTKKCAYCKKKLPIDMFDFSSRSKDGYASTCRECTPKKKQYYERNKEKVLLKCAEYRSTHKEQKAETDKKYAQKNKDKIKQYQKEYRDSHKESSAEYQKQYRIKNKNKLDEYKKSPHVRYTVYQRNAKNKKRNFDLSEDEFIEMSKQPCIYCGEYSDTYNNEPFNGIDRIDSDLGYSINNCVPCCATCNRMKMDLKVDDWINKMIQIINHYHKSA